jgi:hypothetical protein
MKRDTFIFYRSFYEAIIELPEENRCEIFNAIADYSLNFKDPNLSGISKTVWILIKPQLDANNKRFLNGKKPKTKRKTEAKQKQKESKTEANNNNNNNNNNNVGKHLFKNSPLYDKKYYLDKIKETDFNINKPIDYGAYWYSMFDYSEQNGKMYKDWLATARTWIRRDIKEGKIKIDSSKKIVPTYKDDWR